jgi:hypothetical protein
MQSKIVVKILSQGIFLSLAMFAAVVGMAAPVVNVKSASYFPPRPANAEMRYRSGVLIAFGEGMHSGGAGIRDASGRTFEYFTGRPMFIDGKRTRCAIPPRGGERVNPILCEGGWPANVIIGVTRVRVYFWHAVTPWGKDVEVTDQIDRAP